MPRVLLTGHDLRAGHCHVISAAITQCLDVTLLVQTYVQLGDPTLHLTLSQPASGTGGDCGSLLLATTTHTVASHMPQLCQYPTHLHCIVLS
jgi:hypothetical protein